MKLYPPTAGVSLHDMYLEDGTQLKALADFAEKIYELQQYIRSIETDINACLMDHNYELCDQIIANAESVESDAQVCLNFDWDAIQADVNAYHKNRIVELLKAK